MSAVVQSPELNIRPMTAEDIDAVMSIEFSIYPYPWTRRIMADCLRVGYYCMVGEIDGVLAGYCVMSTGADEAHILNLCVASEFQRRGLGRIMLTTVLDEAKLHDVHNVFLEVRPSNSPALYLYEQLGFNEIGLRKDYYPAKDGREDAVILALNLSYWK
ncbi:ribosomal protein S18-alanine N-acetyltransferase [Kaarinaea lacus]